MTQKEILEYNERCAEFLGVDKTLSSYYLPQFGLYKNRYGEVSYEEVFREDELKFHSDWNWIKSVLEKISSLNEDDFSDETQQAFEDLLDLSLFSSKESVCESINNFIKTIK